MRQCLTMSGSRMYYRRKAVYRIMKTKYLIPVMPLGKKESGGPDCVKLAGFYSDNGADGILVLDLSETEEEHEEKGKPETQAFNNIFHGML